MSRQLDIMWAGPDFFTLPANLPGRLNGDDFINFKWSPEIEKHRHRYQIVVESLDTAGPTYRSIGPLQASVQLPFVKFDWHARLGVIPDSASIPAFEAELVRGSTYVVPSTGGRNGRYQMERFGMHRPN